MVICLKCLDRSPSRRYPSAAELLDDVDRFAGGRRIRARMCPAWVRLLRKGGRVPRRAAFAGLAAAVAVAAVGAFWSSRQADHYRRSLAETRLLAARALDESVAGRRTAARHRYASGIKRAQGLWDSRHYDLALELLDDAPPESRGFKWAYLEM